MKKILALIKSRGKTKRELVEEVRKVLKGKGLLNKDSEELQIVFFKKNYRPKVEKVEMQFIPTLYPGMKKQFQTSPKKAPSSNEPPQDKQAKPESEGEMQVIFHKKNPKPKNNA